MVFATVRLPFPSVVEQVARANDHVCHDPCLRTARASRGRGSSLTLGTSIVTTLRFSPASAAQRVFSFGFDAPFQSDGQIECEHRSSVSLLPLGAIHGSAPAEFASPQLRTSRGNLPACFRGRLPGRFQFSSPEVISASTSFPRLRLPNKAPEPTPTSGTVAAEPLGVPAAVVAHL